MLGQCANPSCSNEFRYLHEGKLFLIRSRQNPDVPVDPYEYGRSEEPLRYVWLCSKCAENSEILLDDEGRVSVRTRPIRRADGSDDQTYWLRASA